MVLRYTTLIPSPGFHIGPACEEGHSAGMWRECVPPDRRKKERKEATYVKQAAIKFYLHQNNQQASSSV